MLSAKFHFIVRKLLFQKVYTLALGEISLRLRFNGHFPGGPGLASTRMFPFWILLELKVMEVMVTTGAIRRKNSSQKVTNNSW